MTMVPQCCLLSPISLVVRVIISQVASGVEMAEHNLEQPVIEGHLLSAIDPYIYDRDHGITQVVFLPYVAIRLGVISNM